MKVRITQQFKWSPDGNTTVTEEPGAIVDGAVAESALRTKCGEPCEDEAPPPAPASQPEKAEEKAAPEPKNKAITSAPRNKGK
jgi:hypothetical protein